MNNRITIVPSYARNKVMQDIVSKEDNPFDKQVLSLTSFKNSLLLEPREKKEEVKLLMNDIKDNIDKKNSFYNQLSFPTFFNYFYNFSKLLIRYGIGVDDLPEDSELDKSKKEILSYFLNKNIIESEETTALKNLEDCSNIEILDYFYNDLIDYKEIEKLVSKGAKLVESKRNDETKYICKYANNAVKEVMGLAQEFITDKTKLDEYVLMLNDRDTYIPIIRRIFEYYHIPYKVRFQKTNYEAQRYLAFLNFILRQDMNSFIHAYNYRSFKETNYRLVEFIKGTNLEYEELFSPLTSIKELLEDNSKKDYRDNTFGYKLKDLAFAEEACEKMMTSIRPVLEEIKAYKDKPLYEQCSYAYNTLYSEMDSKTISKTKLDEIQAVHNICRGVVDKESNNYALLAYELSSLKSKERIEYEDGIEIVDVYEDVKGFDKAIILGCIQENYPKSAAMAGFFDEEYVQRVNNFPSLIERSDSLENEYSKLLKNFKEVIFSYPLASVDGDQNQRSILLENYVKKVIKENGKEDIEEESWKYTEMDEYFVRKESIDEKVARDLYLKDGKLNASPSSFEKYVKCPFSYFLEKGLRIDDESELAIEASTVGSIQHHLLELCFKDEIELNKDNIEEKLTPYFEVIKEIIHNKDEEIDAAKKRLAEGLENGVVFLNGDKNREGYDYYPEEKIDGFAWKLGGNEIKFTGKIDRLDKKDNNYRIIDYKSSEKTVTLDGVKKGINFQLLSYLVVYYLYCNNEELVPELFAYLSLKNSTLKKDKVDTKYEKTEEEMRREDMKYSAYLFNNVVLNEDFYKVKKGFNFDEIKDIVEKLFTTVSKKILSGDISIEPTNGACTFCNFSDLCHFTGEEISQSDMPDLTVEGEEDASK